MRLLLAVLGVLLVAQPVKAGLLTWAEDKICVFIVEKAWDEINDWACDEVAGELTGLAAGLLSETGPAEIVEDPAIYFTIQYVCGRLASYLEGRAGIGPDQICSDIGLRRERGLTDDLWANLTLEDVKLVMHQRMKDMDQHGVPVAVFPDGSMGYCWKDRHTGVYSCMEPHKFDRPVVEANPTTQQLHAQADQASQASSTNTAAIAVGSVMGTLLVAALVALVVMYRRVRLAEEHGIHTANGYQLAENLLPSSEQ